MTDILQDQSREVQGGVTKIQSLSVCLELTLNNLYLLSCFFFFFFWGLIQALFVIIIKWSPLLSNILCDVAIIYMNQRIILMQIQLCILIYFCCQYLLGSYFLCNWLILRQNTLQLQLGRSKLGLIYQEVCCSNIASGIINYMKVALRNK